MLLLWAPLCIGSKYLLNIEPGGHFAEATIGSLPAPPLKLRMSRLALGRQSRLVWSFNQLLRDKDLCDVLSRA